MIIKRDDRILGARYLSREGDTGTRWWSAMRGRNRLAVFNGSVVSSEVALGGRPGQLVFDLYGTGRVSVPGAAQDLTGWTVLVTLTGVNVTPGFINRVQPTPPTGDVDSVRVLGSIPSSISWVVPATGGSATHATQTNVVRYYSDLNGGGSFDPVTEAWVCAATAAPGGLAVRLAQDAGAFPPTNFRMWAYSSFVPFGGSVSSENAVAQLTNGVGVSCLGVGGTISATLIPP